MTSSLDESKGKKPRDKIENRAFAVEQHGIDFIPEGERTATYPGIFFMWFGTNTVFTWVILGAVVGSLGLSLAQGLTVIVAGNAFFTFVGFTSIAGPRAGTGMLTVSRSTFGIIGNRVPALLSWFTAVGWTSVNIVIGTLSLVGLLDSLGVGPSTGMKVVSLLAVTGVTVTIAMWGHATILAANTVLSFLLGLGTVVLGVFIVREADFGSMGDAPTAALSVWLVALAVMGAGPMSFVTTGADFSRYLPADARPAKVVVTTALGCFVPGVFISVLGLLASTVTDMTEPIAGIGMIVPGWFLTIYLAVVVLGTVTNNFLNTYSSGMSLLAAGIKGSRTTAVAFNTALAVATAAYVLFFHDLTDSLTAFLTLLIVWATSWCGVFLADMLLRRAHYDVRALHQAGEGPYWYTKGWNRRALGWFVLGTVASASVAYSSLWSGPLVARLDGADLSLFAGLLVSGGGYLLHHVLRPVTAPEHPRS
ncbi:purine-cytosine permease family protein [Streptomyces himalayensis]|uniref:Cytosine permease n=1 Tax=Streptomyces himalayensis subsp. himalayensis TaxID=2756131 RepID=A0A7W0DL63_9ACTN|nr:cytosine permease [Streptomyces himalayensis]MBA2946740.1 cytosine permease [Streptomyces himalayensis subsp. himalayensis]